MKKSLFIVLGILTILIIIGIIVIHNIGMKGLHLSDPRDTKMGIWH